MFPNNLLTNRDNIVKRLFSNIYQNMAFIDSCGGLINLLMLNFGLGGGWGAMAVFLVENVKVAFVGVGYNVVLSALISSHET